MLMCCFSLYSFAFHQSRVEFTAVCSCSRLCFVRCCELLSFFPSTLCDSTFERGEVSYHNCVLFVNVLSVAWRRLWNERNINIIIDSTRDGRLTLIRTTMMLPMLMLSNSSRAKKKRKKTNHWKIHEQWTGTSNREKNRTKWKFNLKNKKWIFIWLWLVSFQYKYLESIIF